MRKTEASKRLERFRYGQIVEIAEGVLSGRHGQVVRIRRSDDGAFVDIIGDPIPNEARQFPADDEYGRGNHVLVYPDECTQC